jgi:hypothetical protein
MATKKVSSAAEAKAKAEAAAKLQGERLKAAAEKAKADEAKAKADKAKAEAAAKLQSERLKAAAEKAAADKAKADKIKAEYDQLAIALKDTKIKNLAGDVKGLGDADKDWAAKKVAQNKELNKNKTDTNTNANSVPDWAKNAASNFPQYSPETAKNIKTAQDYAQMAAAGAAAGINNLAGNSTDNVKNSKVTPAAASTTPTNGNTGSASGGGAAKPKAADVAQSIVGGGSDLTKGLSAQDIERMNALAYMQKPGLMLGDEINKMYGITQDRGTIEKILLDALAKTHAENVSNQGKVEDKFYDSLSASQDSLMTTLRKNRMNAITTGASKGMQAAQEIAAMLQTSQANAPGASLVAQQGSDLYRKYATDQAMATQKALETSNAIGADNAKTAKEILGQHMVGYDADMLHNSTIRTAQMGLEGKQIEARSLVDAAIAGKSAPVVQKSDPVAVGVSLFSSGKYNTLGDAMKDANKYMTRD